VKVFGGVEFRIKYYEGHLKIGSDYVEVGSNVFSADRIIRVDVDTEEIDIWISGEFGDARMYVV